MSNLYERLELLCEKKGITRAQMCKDTGVSQGNITDLKMGRRQSFSAKTLARIARYFDVPIAYLLGDMDEPLPAAANPNLPFDEKPLLDAVEDGYVGVGFPTSKGTLTITSEDFDELAELWNELKARPEMKMLFKSASGATKEQIQSVAKMLDSFKTDEVKEQKQREWF